MSSNFHFYLILIFWELIIVMEPISLKAWNCLWASLDCLWISWFHRSEPKSGNQGSMGLTIRCRDQDRDPPTATNRFITVDPSFLRQVDGFHACELLLKKIAHKRARHSQIKDERIMASNRQAWFLRKEAIILGSYVLLIGNRLWEHQLVIDLIITQPTFLVTATFFLTTFPTVLV